MHWMIRLQESLSHLLLRKLYYKFSRKEELSHEIELDWTRVGRSWYLGTGIASSNKLANREVYS